MCNLQEHKTHAAPMNEKMCKIAPDKMKTCTGKRDTNGMFYCALELEDSVLSDVSAPKSPHGSSAGCPRCKSESKSPAGPVFCRSWCSDRTSFGGTSDDIQALYCTSTCQVLPTPHKAPRGRYNAVPISERRKLQAAGSQPLRYSFSKGSHDS